MIERKAAAFAVLVAASAPALAQSGWAQVGQATAQSSASATTLDRPVLDPRYREGMICVDGHAMRLNQATVRYESGNQTTINLRARVTNGGCSRAFGINSRHTIQSVEVTYDPATLEGASAHVQLYARP